MSCCVAISKEFKTEAETVKSVSVIASFPNPVFIGDTIHTKVTIKEKKDDPKRPEFGQVNEACEILNQNNKCVCYSEHILLVERKKT